MAILASDAFELLRNAHARDRLGHAYLITGPEGSGKRRLVEQLCGLIVGAKSDALRHTDVHSIEPESKSRRIVVEQVRNLERDLHMRSASGGRKAGIIFDADRLQVQASNAFLKTLEEPPAQTHLILVTALPDQLLETILSRCIEVSLLPSGAAEPTERQRRLLGVLEAASKREHLDLAQVFGLVREFQTLLSDAKASSQERSDAEMKAEEQRYKQIADAKWFEEREDYFKALTEARYVAERSRLMETLEAWWADVLRLQALSEAAPEDPSAWLDFPEYRRATQTVAARISTDDALRRTRALETLREHLGNPGVQEPLAIEVAFLRAFGS